MVIEEPEAHLFPLAQKDIVELIVLMVNTTGSKVLLTTHSPYIMTSANLLLYSDKVENKHAKKGTGIIPKNFRLSFDSFAAYKVGENGFGVESLVDQESHMMDTSYIDEISAITNAELERLLIKEMEQ